MYYKSNSHFCSSEYIFGCQKFMLKLDLLDLFQEGEELKNLKSHSSWYYFPVSNMRSMHMLIASAHNKNTAK